MTDFLTLGGPGSGHFGHAGRPGEVGGSAPSDRPELTHDERERIRLYTQTGGTYQDINNSLRRGKALTPELQATVDLLERTMETHGEPAPKVVYRGISGYDPEELGLEVGAEFTDLGFVSTTRSSKEAKKFAMAGESKLEGEAVGIVFRINTKEQRSLDLARFSRYGEEETLLKRGQRFKVTHVKKGAPGETLSNVSMTVVD